MKVNARFKRTKKRIVIKVGSSTITHGHGELNLEVIDALAWEMANAKNHGIDVVLVSSGSIAAGAKRLNLKKRPRDTIWKQAASAVGQVALMNMYNRAFNLYNYTAAQVLLTKIIETNEKMAQNTRNAFDQLLSMNVIPVVNENDTISTFEIEFGDNDTLSAVVSRIIGADLLILLSDIDGLYSDDPKRNENAVLMDEIITIDDRIDAMAKGTLSAVGTGGMATKINAARLCMERGIDTIIANGKDPRILRSIIKGEKVGTIFRGVQ